MSDDELTGMFIRGVTKEIGETSIEDIHSAPFVCAPHTQKLCDAYDTIQNLHSKRIPDAKLTEIFIRGVIGEIQKNDPYTKYTPLGGTNPLFQRYSGVGLISDKDEHFPSPLIVRQAIQGNPAARAGIKRGDRITHVNGISLAYKNEKDSNALIREGGGNRVTLTVIQGCSEKTRNITLTKQVVHDVTSGQVRLMDGHYAYVHLENFNGYADGRVRSTLDDLQKEHGDIKGLIIDLRDNPGGSVLQAVKLTGLFVDKGDVLYEKNQDGREIPWKILEGRKDILPGKPIVVLVNNDSASASELFAGAMQDFGRAVIVGTNTYGKGVMQTEVYLKDKSSFHLTIAYTFTPNHTAIHKVGIKPDVIVKEGANESCTGDEQLAAALKILHERGN